MIKCKILQSVEESESGDAVETWVDGYYLGMGTHHEVYNNQILIHSVFFCVEKETGEIWPLRYQSVKIVTDDTGIQ